MSKKNRAKAGKEKVRAAAKEESAGRAPSADPQGFLLISKALADPTRMSVLRAIAGGEGRCSAVRERLGVSAATLSHHVKELERAGLISVERDGRFALASFEKKVWKQYVAELKAVLA